VLGLRRLLVVDQPPQAREDLPPEDAGQEAADDADWNEDELGDGVRLPGATIV
jgi:hypothetical protein